MIKFITNLFRNKQSNIHCNSCNNIINETSDMDNWIVSDKHYCGKCYPKLIINKFKKQ